jgi:hypothetical protein
LSGGTICGCGNSDDPAICVLRSAVGNTCVLGIALFCVGRTELAPTGCIVASSCLSHAPTLSAAPSNRADRLTRGTAATSALIAPSAALQNGHCFS